MTNIKEKLIAGLICLLVIGAVVGGYFYPLQQAPVVKNVGGNLTATPGIQDANAPVVTASNWDFYNVDVTNALAVDGATTLSGAVTMTGAFGATLFTRNGLVNATSTVNSAETLKAADLISYNHIKYTPNVSSVTLTLPATSTLAAMIPNDGDTMEKTIENATTTSAINITLAAGAGMTLSTASSTSGTTGNTIAPKYGVWLKFLRLANTDIMVYLQR